MGKDVDMASDEEDEEDDEKRSEVDYSENREHANPNSYAWILMRLALVVQQTIRFKQFLKMAGFEVSG